MKFFGSALLGVGLVCVAFGQNSAFMDYVARIKEQIQEIDIEGLQRLQREHGNLTIIDVREDSEWEAGHLQGAVHMSKGVLEWRIQQKIPEQDAPIVLYCGGGNRSAISARNLQEMGYTLVFSLAGGFGAIQGAGLPVETESKDQ